MSFLRFLVKAFVYNMLGILAILTIGISVVPAMVVSLTLILVNDIIRKNLSFRSFGDGLLLGLAFACAPVYIWQKLPGISYLIKWCKSEGSYFNGKL
jgi:hypothetical protein